MKTVIVLAMHGSPPKDFPQREAAEFFGLHGRLEHSTGPERAALGQRFAELDAKMRTWPRTPQNDPYYVGSLEIARHLGEETGHEVTVGFNEFCSPSLDDALDQAVARGALRIIVVTPMLTRGGEHAEHDIPAAIQRARQRHPGAEIGYVWPFPAGEVARFLAAQMGSGQ